MLEQLSKKHDKWINMAFKLCKDSDYAQDMVQDMYLKMYDIGQKNPEAELRDVYVWVVMYTALKDKYRASSRIESVPIEEALHLAMEDNSIEFDDKDLLYLSRAKEFRYLDRGLLLESYNKSLREIEKEFDINYGYIHRVLDKTRRLILRDDYDNLYRNKRNKHKK